ncbi:uncharacterized protein NECHADRAFT_88739 [Fusarium vanettenii 77-13-4]|uniref:AMP-binding enzyme C-terminal domain-containing protein n=1 Tax=Fusarium vanettenii (strain ATCC MYA-4622 / CBS 123669 / FGSC 9596 / NRRL 45880 / 77-13-4) TaxID=660122 RepID=C7ZKA1_FUSV7|nr:uncharacterized protein NECHADRAFT_88739 [Fusarium vanettenii 77-13-4]EEU35489.1 hypothetical protein NECHADRAFT_88739 [Fusarium vanettenii 77-13-4]
MYGPGTVYWMPKFNFEDFLKDNKKHGITSFFTVPPIYMLIAHSPKVSLGTSLIAPAASLSSFQTSECGYSMTRDVTFKMVNRATFSSKALHSQLDTGMTPRPQPEPLPAADIDSKLEIKKVLSDDPVYKGLQVAPAELEATLVSHILIHVAAVIGVPDLSLANNEVPRAFVVADSTRISTKDIQTFIKNELAPQKQLRAGVVFLKQIPKSTTRKILRKVLRDQSNQTNEAAKL